MRGDKYHAKLLQAGWTWNGTAYTASVGMVPVTLAPAHPSSPPNVERDRNGVWLVYVNGQRLVQFMDFMGAAACVFYGSSEIEVRDAG